MVVGKCVVGGVRIHHARADSVPLTLLQKHEKWARVSIPSILLKKPCHTPPAISADPGLTGSLTPRPSAKKEPASNVPPSNLPPFCPSIWKGLSLQLPPCPPPPPQTHPKQPALALLFASDRCFSGCPLQPSAPPAPNTRVPIFPSFPLQTPAPALPRVWTF